MMDKRISETVKIELKKIKHDYEVKIEDLEKELEHFRGIDLTKIVARS